jgi:hypothetical protein
MAGSLSHTANPSSSLSVQISLTRRVPKGNNPPATPDHDAEMRKFVHELFDRA